ncbi:MAG: mandelate racemase/muconate lactonizing enzyme family protein [Bacteroidota bacterium]
MTDRRRFLRTAASGAAVAALTPLAAAETVCPEAAAEVARPEAAAAPALRSAVRDVMERVEITAVRTIRLEFPTPTPRTWNAVKSSGGGRPRTTILEVETDAGVTGAVIPKGPRDLVERYAEKARGQNLLHTEAVWEHLYRDERKPVAAGLDLHAIGSVDLAVWDVVGKVMGLPVHRILGTHKTRLPVYAAGGYYAEDKGIPELVDEMVGYAEEGFTVVKMKVGWLDAPEDAARVRAVCEAVGPGVRVMVDANNGYRSAFEAIRFGRMVEDLDLFWFEEPVAPDDLRGNAEVREALDVPVCAGENTYTRWGARDLVDAHACDWLNLDTIKAGGISEMRKIAALASAYHMPISPHGFAHMNANVVASLANAPIMETYPAKARDFNPALELMPVTDGTVAAPEEPGVGMTVDPSLVERYRIS